MECKQVFQILNQLDKTEQVELEKKDVSFLEKNGLILFLREPEYRRNNSNISRIPSLEKQLENCENAANHYKNSMDYLGNNLKSGWHRFWWNKIKKEPEKIKKEEIDFEYTKVMYKKETKKKEQLENQIAKLNELKKGLEGYVETNQGFMKLTEQSSERIRQLSARMPRLEGVSYNDFVKELEQIWQSVQKRYERFKKMYDFMVEKGFEKESEVIDCALALSNLEGRIENIYNRAMVINNYLYNNDWDSYDRLRIVSAVATQKGRIDQLKDHLKEMFIIMVNDEHKKTYSTWGEAAAIIRIPQGDAKAKYERFDKMCDELHKLGWSDRSAETCYIAAHLARREGKESIIAKNHRKLEKKLIEEAGIKDSTESGIAALILMNAKESMDKKAANFKQAFETMQEYGWKNENEYYAAAAGTCLMPGSIEENVQLLDKVYAMLKKDEFKYNLTNRALKIISGGYRNILNQKILPPSYLISSSITFESDYEDYDDDLVGIFPSIAIIAGISS
ncbi:hypothetical protein AYK26_06015 [Euryarchaeota archaeon SM23-78]|nr:MAG: hypothetical protein AYK26_06015 [Euryarchaeota archaeon SM23-78]MBW3000579.1 hypothetical protein [Candidatus Woesearchaeota archaeon]